MYFFFSVYRQTKEEKLKKIKNEEQEVRLQPSGEGEPWVSLDCPVGVACVAVWSTVPTVGGWKPLAHQLVHAEIACESNDYPVQILSKKGGGRF